MQLEKDAETDLAFKLKYFAYNLENCYLVLISLELNLFFNKVLSFIFIMA